MFVFGRYEVTFSVLLVIWIAAYKYINNIAIWLLFIPLSVVFVRTVRSWYFKEDIFAHDRVSPFTAFASESYENEVMEHMCQPIWVEEVTTPDLFPALVTELHVCRPEVFISENGKWKATVTHTSWHVIPGVIIKHKFTVKYESAI